MSTPHSALDLCEHGAYFLEIRIRLKIDSAESWDRGLWDKKTRERKKEPTFDRCKRILGTLGLWMSGRDDEKKERFWCSRDVNGAQQMREFFLSYGCTMPQTRTCR